jgi:hypothetical protein
VRGCSYIELGQLTLARHSYLLSLELQPDHERALNQLRYIQGLQAVAGTEEVEPVREGVETPTLQFKNTCPAGK